MGILSDGKILNAYLTKEIRICPFSMDKLNPNGYNLSLNEKLLVYTNDELDMKNPNPTKEIIIPPEGLVLQPGELYLGKTNEYTETCAKYVPMLEGRSSTGRLGIDVHICAGAGDAGYKGNWTLEIRVVKPVRVYPNVDVCQIMYHEVSGEVVHPYNGKYQGKTDVNASEIFKDNIFDNIAISGAYTRKTQPSNGLELVNQKSETSYNITNNKNVHAVLEDEIHKANFLCNKPRPIVTSWNPYAAQIIEIPKEKDEDEMLIKIDNHYLKDEYKDSIFIIKSDIIDNKVSDQTKDSLNELQSLVNTVNESMDNYCKEYCKKYNLINGTEKDKTNIVYKK